MIDNWIGFILLVFIVIWCDNCIDERRKQKKINQDREKEALEYCDKMKKDLERIDQDIRNGKYITNGKVDFKRIEEDRGDAADCLLSYVKSLHILRWGNRGSRNDKDISSRISTHLVIANEIRDTACDFVYHGVYDEYKNKRIKDIVIELMDEPYE